MNWHNRACSQFHHDFWSRVASYIVEPSSWVCFSQVCHLFARIAREWAPQKKEAFRVTLEEWVGGAIHSKLDIFVWNQGKPLVLPNGDFHGKFIKFVKHANWAEGEWLHQEFNNGKIITRAVYPEPSLGSTHMYISGKLIVFDFHTKEGISLLNACTGKEIYGYRCGFCERVHMFISGKRDYLMLRNCFEKSYMITSVREYRAVWSMNIRQDVKRRCRAILKCRAEIASLLELWKKERRFS